jgi:DNA replication protein DnaC
LDGVEIPPQRLVSTGPLTRSAGGTAACPKCGGTSVITYAEGNNAVAKICDCSLKCLKCRGTKFIFERDKDGQEVARMCECETRRQRVRLFNEAGIPAKYHDAVLPDASKERHDAETYKGVRWYAKSYKEGEKGFVLMGRPGCGKTYLICGVLREMIFSHGVPVQFRDFFHLLSDLRSGYSNERPESELIQPLVDVEVLAIDELGKGRNTPWEQNILDVIISHRYNARKTTLFTSNYTNRQDTTLQEPVRGKDGVAADPMILRETLRDRVGPRIYSRLQEMCDFFTLNGPDRRETLLSAELA